MNRSMSRLRSTARSPIQMFAAVAFLTLAVVSLPPRPAQAGGGDPPSATPTPAATPGPPVKIVFDPPEPNPRPGTQLLITAKALDKDNKEIEGGQWDFKLSDEEHATYVIYQPKGNRLAVSGLFGGQGDGQKAGQARPSAAPFIVTFKKGDAEIRRVLNVGLTDGGRPSGPIPPGLKPQVDVMWSVLPSNVVHANFGRKVKGDYYGIQIVIGNNSGYDLQIASAGFTLKTPVTSPSGAKYPLPTASYQLARASLAREQEVGLHARFVNGLDAVGPVLTGFVPFFKAVNRRSNFSQLVNIFSNPFSAGAKLIAPDTTIGQLGRLEQQTFRNDQTARTIIPNNTQISIVTFFPKDSLKRYMRGNLGYTDGDLKNPLKVMEALGDLVLVGQQIEYLNRIRLISDNDTRDEFTISGRVTDGCGNGAADVDVKLSGGPFFKDTTVKTGANGTFKFERIPSGDDYKVTPSKTGVTFTSEGGDSFRLEDDRTNVNFRSKQAAYTIGGKVTGPSGPAKDVKITLSDGKTDTTKADGSYSFTGLMPGQTYDVTPTSSGTLKFTGDNAKRVVGVLNCNQTDVNFAGVAP